MDDISGAALLLWAAARDSDGAGCSWARSGGNRPGPAQKGARERRPPQPRKRLNRRRLLGRSAGLSWRSSSPYV
jgi:hypothetical protein